LIFSDLYGSVVVFLLEFESTSTPDLLLQKLKKDPQMRAAGAIVKLDYPGVGSLETVNSPVFVNGVAKRQPSPAPDIGADTAAVLRELGYGPAEIAKISGGMCNG
jgi:crotonobetainyl-CoA:carnitine CoA-transferase CaiB-like acyl-CoA transferase